MIKFSAQQMAQFSERAIADYGAEYRPRLVAEFGKAPVAAIEPLGEVAKAAVAIKLDKSDEIYRFMRVMAALEKMDALPQRRMLIVQISGQWEQPEERLVMMERAAFLEPPARG